MPLMGFGIGLTALGAAEALEAVAVLSKALGFDPAIVARHGWNLLEIHSRKRDT
jgi:hypothetical protein